MPNWARRPNEMPIRSADGSIRQETNPARAPIITVPPHVMSVVMPVRRTRKTVSDPPARTAAAPPRSAPRCPAA